MSSTAVARHRATAPAVEPKVAGASVVRRIAGVLGNLVLLACAAAFLAIAVGPHLFDYRTSTMLTGSMSPGIDPGDMVVTVPRPTADLEVGDVISYQIPVEDHRVETHRVASVKHRADGTTAITTKGDANVNVDPWVAIISTDTVYEVQTVVPKVGTAIRVLRAPIVQDGILWVALGGVMVLGLSMIWGTKPDMSDTDEGPREQS
ncbi:signal peptidase I [Nocardioides sp. SR21]|uniref:signal peptidase I n=1 Tax=Nocardioides sp. SR21 TaxID=2919501 RepID=UPI001FA96F87|nr:signal peptidase I [Nocardioides sp. SR21]